jgi:hypothetical protein
MSTTSALLKAESEVEVEVVVICFCIEFVDTEPLVVF